MRLSDLEQYNPVTIQCHDNPDADALASGFGLYCYFTSKGIDTRFIYSGWNCITKANLKLMVEKLDIPIEYWKPVKEGPIKVDGLLITVDCQYRAGNVTQIEAEEIAVIDHHQIEIKDNKLFRIQPNLGSCATLVWNMLMEEKFPIEEDSRLGTALYYGLYTDTNQFSEVFNPLDMDMREAVSCNKSLITLFRNSNLSLKELEIAGIAMLRYSYNDDYHFAVIKSQPCDPNILGLISDFLLQVDEIDTCVVYNEVNDGYKYSVRSCIKEVHANELAAYLGEGIGSGGGHNEKAGGFISRKLYEESYPTLHSEAYFNNKMTQYFDSHEIIYAASYEPDISDMQIYEKKMMPEKYVDISTILPLDTPVTIRTQAGDLDMKVEDGLHIVVSIKGEISLFRKEEFEKNFAPARDCGGEDCRKRPEYVPTIKNRADGGTLVISDYVKGCVPIREKKIYASPLKKAVKVFGIRDQEWYKLGQPGDYLALDYEDIHDVFVVEKEIFEKNFEEKQ